MAYDDDQAEKLRLALSHLDGITEKKMFGGLCFMLSGNMLCGVHKGGGMARVGKEHEPRAIAFDGVDPLSFTGRKMGGMVDLSADALDDDRVLSAVLEMAIDFVAELPPK
ncbi:MAG: TfoX/Sxy family transcriptional regulator of competence genes [Pirellulaceae bacterium]|jgi:TfoX/Sxy family transcriptional regulator of competence genes